MDKVIEKYQTKIDNENKAWDELAEQLKQQFNVELGAHLGRIKAWEEEIESRKKELEEAEIENNSVSEESENVKTVRKIDEIEKEMVQLTDEEASEISEGMRKTGPIGMRPD